MKTAEEVAADIADNIFCYDDDDLGILKNLTAQAITAFAEERVRETYGPSIAGAILTAARNGRAEALEQAALLAENWILWTPDHVTMFIASIRALKNEPKQTPNIDHKDYDKNNVGG